MATKEPIECPAILIESISSLLINWIVHSLISEMEDKDFPSDNPCPGKSIAKTLTPLLAKYLVCICHTEASIPAPCSKRKYGLSDLVTVIGDREYWGKNIASLAIKKAIKIGFKCAKIRKFSASIDSLNKGSIKAYIKGGFIKEGVIPKYFLNTKNSQVILSDKIFVGLNNKDYDIDYFATCTPVNKTSNFWKDFTINER